MAGQQADDVGELTSPPLPTGVVTYCLTDIEGSTKQWNDAPGAMGDGEAEWSVRTLDRLTAERLAVRGDLAGAAAAIETAVERAAASQSATWAGTMWCEAARYRLAVGDHGGAAAAADEADGLLRGRAGYARTLLLVGAEVAAATGDAARARALLRSAAVHGLTPRARVTFLETLAETAARDGNEDRRPNAAGDSGR